jgi:hypothetical protein
MAVTIDEMQVDVTGAQSQPASAAAPASQQRVDLKTGLDVLRERELRLRAD